MRKAKFMFENVCQFMVAVVRPFSGRTARQPTALSDKRDDGPRSGTRRDHHGGAEAQVRMVAISRWRLATAAYMVLESG